MKYAEDAPEFADFVAALDPVNAIADASQGFVWRLKSDAGNPKSLTDFENKGWLVNMSVWESLDDLVAFVREPAHLAVMKRRREWFKSIDVYMCLWWVPAGHIPSFEEAIERLEHIRENGPGPLAFNFAHPLAPPA